VFCIEQAHLLNLDLIEHHLEAGSVIYTQDVLQENVLSHIKHAKEESPELDKLKAKFQDRLAILFVYEPNGYTGCSLCSSWSTRPSRSSSSSQGRTLPQNQHYQ